MNNGSKWPMTAMLLAGSVALVAVLPGCGGGDGGGGLQTGSAAGVVRVLQGSNLVGLGNVTITIGGRTAVTDANGEYEVKGIQPGGPYVVHVTPPTGSVVPPGTPAISVQVFGGQTTQVPNISLIDEGDVPPDPPY